MEHCDFSSISTYLKNQISESNQKKLATTIQRNLLPLMADCNMVIQDIYTLFMQDDTISDTKKQEIASLYKPFDSRLLFLAKVLSFGMERQFIKRDTRNQKLIAGGALSPIVLDYIMGSEVPKPCLLVNRIVFKDITVSYVL